MSSKKTLFWFLVGTLLFSNEYAPMMLRSDADTCDAETSFKMMVVVVWIDDASDLESGTDSGRDGETTD